MNDILLVAIMLRWARQAGALLCIIIAICIGSHFIFSRLTPDTKKEFIPSLALYSKSISVFDNSSGISGFFGINEAFADEAQLPEKQPTLKTANQEQQESYPKHPPIGRLFFCFFCTLLGIYFWIRCINDFDEEREIFSAKLTYVGGFFLCVGLIWTLTIPLRSTWSWWF